MNDIVCEHFSEFVCADFHQMWSGAAICCSLVHAVPFWYVQEWWHASKDLKLLC